MREQVSKLKMLVEQQKRMQQTPKARIVSVSSGKGGVGKTSFAVNFAIALSQQGKRVLIIDADFGLANIDVMLGVCALHDLTKVISGEMDIRDVVVEGHHGIQFISGGSGVYDLITLDEDRVLRLVSQLSALEDMADIILFDNGAGISDVVLRLFRSSNDAFIITTPEPTSVMDAYALVKTANRFEEKPKMHLVVNMAGTAREGADTLQGFTRVVSKNMGLELDKAGYILRDSSVIRAVKAQVPLMIGCPGSMAAQNIHAIAARFLEIPAQENRAQGIARFLNRFLKRHTEDVG